MLLNASEFVVWVELVVARKAEVTDDDALNTLMDALVNPAGHVNPTLTTSGLPKANVVGKVSNIIALFEMAGLRKALEAMGVSSGAAADFPSPGSSEGPVSVRGANPASRPA